MDNREELVLLAAAIERVTVEVQELAVASATTIGTRNRDAILATMGKVNKRLVDAFPELRPVTITDGEEVVGHTVLPEDYWETAQ